MFKWFLYSLMIPLLTSCFQGNVIQASGDDTTEEFLFDPTSTELLVCNVFHVDLNDSMPEGMVRISTDENTLKYVEVKNRAGKLSLQLKGRYKVAANVIHASMAPGDFRKFVAVGASKIRSLQPMNRYDLDIQACGASAAYFKGVEASQLSVEATGASKIVVSGKTERVKATATGASSIDARRVTSVDAKIKAIGTSLIEVHASGEISGSSTGVSKVTYFGNPEACNISVTGVSVIEKGDSL